MARLIIALLVAVAASAVVAMPPPNGPPPPPSAHPTIDALLKGVQAAESWFQKEKAALKGKAVAVGHQIAEIASKDKAWLKANQGHVLATLKSALQAGAKTVAEHIKAAGPGGRAPRSAPPAADALAKGVQAAQSWFQKEKAALKGKAAAVGQQVAALAAKDKAWLQANQGHVLATLKSAVKAGAKTVAEHIKAAGPAGRAPRAAAPAPATGTTTPAPPTTGTTTPAPAPKTKPAKPNKVVAAIKKAIATALAWFKKEGTALKAEGVKIENELKEWAAKDDAWIKANEVKVLNALRQAAQQGADGLAKLIEKIVKGGKREPRAAKPAKPAKKSKKSKKDKKEKKAKKSSKKSDSQAAKAPAAAAADPATTA